MVFKSLEAIRSLAIVGATGLVGREFIELLAEQKIRIPNLKLLASSDSEGETLEVYGETYEVETLSESSFEGVEVAFFSVPNEVTKRFTPAAVKAGCIVVDDSSVFRMDPEVPLVVPEINGSLLRDFQKHIISIPNCSTTPVALCLQPILERWGIQRVVVSTYQSVSGAGTAAFNELRDQTGALLNGQSKEPMAFPHPIAFNCLPLIGDVAPTGNSNEEEKVIKELRKILNQPELRVSATAVRVPTFFGHGASVNVELKKNLDNVEEVRELLDKFEGLRVLDKAESAIYPTNREAAGSDLTFVGRIRRDASVPSGINFWVVTDNLRKGAALNALQCLDLLYGYRKLS